jgi:hypothetical protein
MLVQQPATLGAIEVPSTPQKGPQDVQSGTPSTCPGTPFPTSAALAARVAELKEIAENTPKPNVWNNDGCQHAMPGNLPDHQLWEEVLVNFGACEVSTAHAAQHFEKIITAGMDANAVPFPSQYQKQALNCILARTPAMYLNQVPFPLFHEFDSTKNPCKSDQDKEAIDMLVAGQARTPEDLRKAFHTEPLALDMELVQWPSLEGGVVMADECTQAQLHVWKLREENPLTLEKIEKKRAVLARKLNCELNPRVFAEIYPELEREAAKLKWEADRAHDKAEEQRNYDELAAKGAALVAWVVPNEQRWPEQPSAWKRHCKWFAMWRSKPPVASNFGFQPIKRSSSESSLQSWAAVSDVSWVEIESKASECGWQDVLEEQMPALSAAKPGASLCAGDIAEIKCFATPPRGVVLTMEVICILLQVPPKILKNGALNYWEPAKTLLSQADFLAKVCELGDFVPASALDAAAPYMSLDEFTPERVGGSSLACRGLCVWAREVYKYHLLGQASAEAARRHYASKQAGELVAESQKAIESLTLKSIQELKSLPKPPRGVDVVCSCLLHLLAGIAPEVELTKKGNVKDASWKSCQKFLSDPAKVSKKLVELREVIDAGGVPRRNVERVRKIQVSMGNAFSVDEIKKKSAAAAEICAWLMCTISYFDVAAPNRHEEIKAVSNQVAKLDVAETQEVSIGTLTKGDIVELKALCSPPQPIMIICVCVCILRPVGSGDASEGWAGAKRMLGDPCLMKALLMYKKEDVTEKQKADVHALLDKDKENFESDNIKKVSCAAYGLLQWVRFMVDYD